MAEKTEEIVKLAKEINPDLPDQMSLETLVLLINTERLKNLQDSTANEFKELKERQDKVRKLHELLQNINRETSEKGELSLKNKTELIDGMKQLKDHGISLKDDKLSYSRDERERLIENIKMTIEDLNVQNDMQLQKITRLTNERYESYQMARSILKPLHDDKHNKARAMSGR
jgi:hypothetical protein